MSDFTPILLERLQQSGRFPAHGWIAGPEGKTCLVLPIMRCVGESEVGSVKDLLIRGYFREMLFRILTLLRNITKTESAIRSHWPSDGMPLEHVASWQEAYELLPMYVEQFFHYFRLFADRFTVVIRPIVSSTPQSFPIEYKTVLSAARGNGSSKNWGWKIDEQHFLTAVATHSEWYDLLVGPIGDCQKGIRDTLNHRMVAIRYSLIGVDPHESQTQLRFEGAANDIPNVELFSAVEAETRSFSELLSALPTALWRTQNYEHVDFVMTWNSNAEAITSRFPRII
mgnify:CR=1 FL=1